MPYAEETVDVPVACFEPEEMLELSRRTSGVLCFVRVLVGWFTISIEILVTGSLRRLFLAWSAASICLGIVVFVAGRCGEFVTGSGLATCRAALEFRF